MRHTKEPWHYMELPAADGDFMVLGGEGQEYGLAASCIELADARRIVACVNACVWADTEFLEGATWAEHRDAVDAELESLRKQRDDLLAELLRVKEICLREVGIGIVNEVVLANVKEQL